MSPGRQPAGLMDPPDHVVEGRVAALDVPGRTLIEIPVKGLPQVAYITLLDQQPREMGTTGLRAAQALGLFPGYLQTEFPKPGCQPGVPLPTGRLETRQMPAKLFAGGLVKEVAEHVNRVAVKLRAELHPTDQVEAGGAGDRQRLVETLHGVVVGDCERAESPANRELNQLGRRETAVRPVRVGV